ncbi:uncharacterized protein [Parasteatoda tepidariorum]|uniref:uncharacterized protein isoform X1 n=1 Tax=Parasteatoda tepidariorum TaxID=114398 RepID=UPI00077FCFAE|nr:abhydrolase domain-containing protein C22H12.03-like [Parasteatoda tepidariorum]
MMNEKIINGCGVHLAYKVFSPDKFSKQWSDGFNNRKTNLENDDAEHLDERHPPSILLHGLANTKETWDDCAQGIANGTSTLVYSLEARNHGDSGWIDKIDYNNLADDVACFMDSMGIPTAILIGHSMGGLTAMNFAFRHPHRLHSIIIEDMSLNSSPAIDKWCKDYIIMLRKVLHLIPPEKELPEAKIIAAVYLDNRPLEGKPSEAKKIASDYLDHRPVVKTEESTYNNALQPVKWVGRDLALRVNSSGDGFEWKTNLDVLQNLMESGEFTPCSIQGIEKEMTYEGPVLMIYGTSSPVNVPSDKEVFLNHFPNAVYEAVEDAEHRVHIGYPETFTRLVCEFILKHRHLKCNI